jgi:D-3-phosphoglycerate dehydrogenase / 2-oxoglutarate reductase
MVILLTEPFDPQARRVLEAVGDVVEWDEARLADADALVTGLDLAVDEGLLARAGKLRLVASRTSQLRHLDLAALERRGIEVLSIEPDAPALQETSSTAEETLALILALVRNLPWAFDSVKAGRWERRRYGGHELKGMTLGVIGYGRLGRMVARYGEALGMQVLLNDPNEDGITLDELLRTADVVTLHASYDGSPPLLREEHFRSMKPSAYFVNTARGELADEAALLRALEKGWIAGAAVDTLAGELPDGSHVREHPLIRYANEHENLIVVPHLGGATREATTRTQLYIAQKLVEWVRGHE